MDQQERVKTEIDDYDSFKEWSEATSRWGVKVINPPAGAVYVCLKCENVNETDALVCPGCKRPMLNSRYRKHT